MIDGQAPATGSAPAEAPAPTVDSIAGLFEAQITAERNPPKEVEAPADEAETTETVSDDAEAPETEAENTDDESVDEAELDQDSEPDEAPAAQAIEAPPGMSEADRAEFAKLPPGQRAWIAKRFADQTADYTRKTQDVAQRRKAVDGMAQEVMGRIQSYDQILAKFTDAQIDPPDPSLRMTDPEAYEQQLANYVHRRDLKEKAQAERGRVQQEAERFQAAQKQAYWQAEAETLSRIAPELATGPNATKTRKEIFGFAQKLGYSPEELEMASAKDMVTLHKAMLYDAQVAAKKAVKVVPKPAPKVIKPGSASAGGRPSQLASAVQQMRQNPTVESLAAAFEAELKAEKRR
jgi:hypothetical protein